MMILFKLIQKEEFNSIIPFLQILNNKIDEGTLRYRLQEMMEQGYECVGVYDEDKLIGISGLWIFTWFYVGKFIEPDDVVIMPEYRNAGIGKMLMNWIYEYGKSKGCIASELNCYITNASGQKFWMNQGYKVIGFHFQKGL
ncbi:MAG: GNAT family N-acetyltransferase [Chitinophagaceae bacterium]